jgi:hypothetical protein
MKRLKIKIIVVILSPEGSVHDFLEFYKVDFDFDPKASFQPKAFASMVKTERNDIRFSRQGFQTCLNV